VVARALHHSVLAVRRVVHLPGRRWFAGESLDTHTLGQLVMGQDEAYVAPTCPRNRLSSGAWRSWCLSRSGRLDTMPQLLNDMPLERANQLFNNPIHQDAYRDLAQLIVNLRQCRTYEDYYHFQQELLVKVLAVQEHRAACTRVVKRLRSGKGVPADAPELRGDADRNNPDAWELEADVCERVDRQLRSIADALAWRLFDYDRRVIVALSRNGPSGPMTGKEGLAAEQAFLIRSWQDDHCFVLLHDLTSCLHIGDATLFKAVGREYEAYLYEIKTDPSRRKSAQLRRKRLAEEAIRDGGPLPNDAEARLIDLDIRYKTHLKMLRDAFEKATTRGVIGMKVPGGRALVAANLSKGYELWPEREFIERTGDAHDAACQRAGILGRGHPITFFSNDMVARSPTVPPWAIYPLHPVVCASLIVDMTAFFVTISSEPLIEALREAGLTVQWLLPPDLKQLIPNQEVIRIHNGVRSTEMRSSELQRLALELVDLPTWVGGIREMFSRDDVQGRPWHYFANERKVWA
jgi:hypothetical protein